MIRLHSQRNRVEKPVFLPVYNAHTNKFKFSHNVRILSISVFCRVWDKTQHQLLNKHIHVIYEF
jgi:hypothetical protein